MQINENIKQARLSKGFSQEKVAKLIGEKRSTYAEWERNIIPKADILSKISSALSVPLEELLSGNKVNISIADTVTPRILELQATVMALANTILTKEQWNKFNKNRSFHLKQIVQELVKEQPHLLEEAPELGELLKKSD